MWRVVRPTKSATATLAAAVQYRDMKTLERDRAVKKPILGFLREKIRSGEAKPFDISLCWCIETGELYRVNGKHSSIVCAEYLGDKSIVNKNPLTFNITEYEGDTLQDVARLYETFDSRVSVKTPLDIYMSYASTDSELKELSSVVIKSAVTGIDFALSDGASVSESTIEQRALRILSEKAFVLFLNRLRSEVDGLDGKKSRLDRTPVAAAMYLTYKKYPKDAWDFWSLVKSEDAPSSKCPTRQLANWLKNSAIVRTSEKRKGVEDRGRREMLGQCLHAWGLWRQNKPWKKWIYREERPLPKVA